jgi:hypothetical protein
MKDGKITGVESFDTFEEFIEYVAPVTRTSFKTDKAWQEYWQGLRESFTRFAAVLLEAGISEADFMSGSIPDPGEPQHTEG